MKFFCFRLFILSFAILPLSACFGPTTPQEVTRAFWKAVINNDVSDVVNYSTLTDSKYYDSFTKDWGGYQASFDKVIIEDNAASIVTEITSPTNSDKRNRKFTTYLIMQNNKWLVDYERTKSSVTGGVLGALIGSLSNMGSGLSEQLQSSADKFQLEMDRMGEELENLSESFEQEASRSIKKYAEELRKSIEEMQRSIDRALEDDKNNLSDEDRRSLQSISAELEQDSKNLSEPSVESVSTGSRNLGMAQKQLDTIDNDSLDEYKIEWRELSEKFKDGMRKILDDLSSRTEANSAE